MTSKALLAPIQDVGKDRLRDSTDSTVTSGLTLISDQILSTNGASITFTDIPQTFIDLQLRIVGAVAGLNVGTLVCRFNGDVGSDYEWEETEVESGAFFGGNESSGVDTTIELDTIAGEIGGGLPAATGSRSHHIFDIPSYRSTFFKTISGRGSRTRVGAATVVSSLSSAMWEVTDAITQIVLYEFSGANFLAGTRATLYGIG